MTNSSQVNKLSLDIVLAKRINTERGIIYLYRLLNYKNHLSKLGKLHLQKAIVTLILNNILDNSYILTHHESGSPVLENKSFKEVSISHSHGYFAVYLAYEEAVGVDLEIKRTINHDGFGYFLNENEIKQSWSDSELLSIWCAKEAYYKLKKGEVYDLRLDVTVTGILNGIISVKTVDEYLTFNIIEENNYTLVYS